MHRMPRGLSRAVLFALLAALIASGAFVINRVQAGVFTAPNQGASSAQWSGSIVVQNHGQSPATVVINFYSTTGVLVKSYPLPSPIPSKGTIAVDTESIGDLPNGFSGSAVVSANQPVSTVLQGFDSTNPAVNRTLYDGFTDGALSVYVPAISNAYADQTSLLAVQNVDNTPASVSIRYFERFTGQQSAIITDTIPPNASHFYDSSALPAAQTLAAPWTGAALLQSTGGRIVAAVHQPYLSSNKAVAFEGTAAVGTEVYLPSALYLYAPQQQTSFIAVQNTQANPIDAAVTFYNRDGSVSGTAGGQIQGFQKQSWNPGSAGIGAEFNGSAVVRASGPIAVAVNIGSATDLSLAYTGQLQGTTKQALPYIRWSPSSNQKGWRTYVAVMNVDQTLPADITLRYYDTDGSLTFANTITNVAPNTKANHNPGMFIGDSTFIGTIEIQATRSVIGLVNAITVDNSLAESYTSIAIP